MEPQINKRAPLRTILLIAFGIIFVLFLFSLFKNIQYPLLWNDESETAVYAKRILQYGYPKINDGKNIVWLSYLPDRSIGINKNNDSCEALVWGQYYFAAIGEFFAGKVNDIYLKTALLRIPFAAAGLIGLIIMALSVSWLFGKNSINELIFFNSFFLLALFSVPLVLHMREVRHPSLEILLAASILYTYFSYRYHNRIKFTTYFAASTILLFCLYHVFHLTCFIFLAAIGLYEAFLFLKEKDLGRFLRNVAPLLASLMIIAPFFILCKTMAMGEAYRNFLKIGTMPFWDRHIIGFVGLIQKYDFLYPAIAAKIAFFCIFIYISRVGRNASFPIKRVMRISNFLGFLIIFYSFTITFFPHHFIFERYYIVLYPVIMMILLLDIFGSIKLLASIESTKARIYNSVACVLIISCAAYIKLPDMMARLKGHAYEISHQYKGPMDFIIPFIKSHHTNPENLVIATNYEELDYVYYLGSKVIVGFAGNTLKEDLKLCPDIIVVRKRFSFVDTRVFDKFLAGYSYEMFVFPVRDYFVNNIPESVFHLYKTPDCSDEKECLAMLIRLG